MRHRPINPNQMEAPSSSWHAIVNPFTAHRNRATTPNRIANSICALCSPLNCKSISITSATALLLFRYCKNGGEWIIKSAYNWTSMGDNDDDGQQTPDIGGFIE